MPQPDKSTDPTEKALNAAQVVFSLNPAYAPHAKRFWQAQEQYLQAAEKYSSAWFKRRHDATRSALDLAAQIANNGIQDPGAMMKAMSDWQTQSMERLAQDSKDCAEMMASCVGSVVTNEIEAVEETADNTKRATTAKHATAV